MGLGSLAKVEEDDERSSKEAGMIPGFKISIDNGITKNIYDSQIFSCKTSFRTPITKIQYKIPGFRRLVVRVLFLEVQVLFWDGYENIYIQGNIGNLKE